MSAVTVPSSAHAKRRNLSFRILSGLVLAPPVIALAYYGGPAFAVVMALAAGLALREWVRIVSDKSLVQAYAGFAVAVAVYLVGGIVPAIVTLAVAAVLLGITAQFTKAQNSWLAAAGLPYVALTALLLPWLHDSGGAGWRLSLFVLLAVWASDIGAYAFGRAIGGPKLAPRISPNKTWAGLAGAVIVAALVTAGFASAIGAAQPGLYAAVAAVLALVGQIGDLFESSIKRRFQVKDSGELIPGHGGMLDRIDALLFAVPVFAMFHVFGLTAGMLQ